ncbi:ACSA-like protein [Mya arenaria]|uniref:acetate--CoA ligase n=1 Tax=Mya arenaria TaxID=6604 RepID=A0ABY7FYC9_MYAAR|nr:ACSA-like protein [Mya arenaria]
MADNHHPSPVLIPPPSQVQNEAHVKSMDQYREMYKKSVEDPVGFWGDIAKAFHWESGPTGKFLEYNFDVRNGPIFIKWMQGAKTNVCYNAVDRHVKSGNGSKIAFYWEGNDPGDCGKVTFSELQDKVCRFANVLKSLDGVWRGSKLLNLKAIEEYVVNDRDVEERPGQRPSPQLKIEWHAPRDKWWHELVAAASPDCPPVWLDAEDPLFMLYTSTTLISNPTMCTGAQPMLAGLRDTPTSPTDHCSTVLLFEGVPTYPDAGRFWAIIEKYRVSKFYTAPTAIRTLMGFGDDFVTNSLKVIATVGEPINPEAWLWYYNVVGNKQAAVVDTFWQTETTFPFFGVVPIILNEEGKEVGVQPAVARSDADSGYKDKDGYIWVTGRIDDMVNVSGHLLSTAEIESALVEHPTVTEAAGSTYSPELAVELIKQVREKIGPFAQPDFIQEAPGLPKTRSGKIMRRVLRKIAIGDRNIGDVTTMADESVVDILFKLRPDTA